MVNEFITSYGMEIISTVLVAVFGFIGTALKKIYREFVNDQKAERVVKTVVKAVKQLYSDLDGEAKFEKAVENASEILAGKGIAITELELMMMIESAVEELKANVESK